MAFPPSTWASLWTDCFATARRPLTGICLPKEEAERVARSVFEALLQESKLGPLPEVVEFLRSRARKFSLSAVAKTRLDSGAPDRWADPQEGQTAPTVSLHKLQQDQTATYDWQQTLALFRQRSYNTVKSQGVPLEEIDDVLADTLLALFKPRADGVTRPLDSIQVYEELMPLLHTMAKHVATDHMRARSAQKRQPGEGCFVDWEAGKNVASDDSAPGEAVTLHQCYLECRDCLTDFQWDLLIRLYVLESVNRMELIEEPGVLRGLGLKANVSSATRRRRLNEYLDEMIAVLASRMRLP